MKSVTKPSQAFDPSLLIGIALLVSALVVSGGVNYYCIMQMREDTGKLFLNLVRVPHLR